MWRSVGSVDEENISATKPMKGVVLMFVMGCARAPKPKDTVFRSRKHECEAETCGHITPPELAANCVNECISKECYDEVYAVEPLEDGEIDYARSRTFQSCFRRRLQAGYRDG